MEEETETFEVGDRVTFWLTGSLRNWEGEVRRLNEDGYPDRIRVLDKEWHAGSLHLGLLKPGDFVIRWKSRRVPFWRRLFLRVFGSPDGD